MIVDAHVHILPDRVRDNLGVITADEPWFISCHAGGKRTASAESALTTMDASGVDRAVCFAWPFADPALCREGNDYIAAVQRRYPDRIIGFGTVQPASPDAPAEVERCARLGLHGLGELNADAQGWALEDTSLDAVVAASVHTGLPWTLHCSDPDRRDHPGKGTATPDRVIRFAQRFGDLRLICAHLGGGLPLRRTGPPRLQVIARRGEGSEDTVPDEVLVSDDTLPGSGSNLWFDTAAAPFLYEPAVYRAIVDRWGPDRLLFGTDHPLLDAPRYAAAFAEAGLSDQETAAVMGGALARMLRL